LSNAAAVQPMLVVLEDLHDADKGTLDMLTHVSRNLAGARLLIVGTYRDVEVDRSHPLSAALAELRRVSTYGRVLLRGLNADEVQRMLESITRESVPWGLAEAVHRQTEGNPLFVQEVVRYLAEEGLITRKEGRWRPTKDTPLEMSIPEGLRDVIGKRLSSLSQECNRLLSVAAVIGREFRLNTLREVAGIEEDKFVDALKDAVGLAILEEQSQVGAIRYRFTHAFFRQTLYEEIIAPQRLQRHQQVARVLETQYANRPEEHAAELAEHFAQSTDHADLTKAVSYGEMAAQRALAVYAYGENVRLLEKALKVQEVLDPDDKEKQCDLLGALSSALTIAGEPRRALDVELPAALSLAESINDRRRTSRVCLLALGALASYGPWRFVTAPEFAWWFERADRYAEPNTVERASTDAFLGVRQCLAGHPEEGVPFLSRALDLARQLGDTNAFWRAAQAWLRWVQAPQHVEERLHLAEELAATPREGLNMVTLGMVLSLMVVIFLESGQRQRAEELFNEAREVAERSSQLGVVLWFMRVEATLATLDGRLEEALEISRRMKDRGEESGISEFTSLHATYGNFTACIHPGRFEEALQLVKSAPTPLLALAGTICLAHLGRDAEVVEILKQQVVARPGIGTAKDETWAYDDIMLLEAAVIVGHHQAAELLLGRFAGSNVHTTSIFYVTCPARHLGGAAALLGRPEEARRYYKEAIKVCTEMRFRPELALTWLQVAELLMEHYPKKRAEALEHLNFAIKEFRDMKMRPSLERALKHKEILGA
ncbi:MAG: hypothetical protein JSW38_01685, partial [Dehalococcoidia bacterium]